MKRPLFSPLSPSSTSSDESDTAESVGRLSGTAELVERLIDPIDPIIKLDLASTRIIQPKKEPQVVIRVKSNQDGDTRSTKRRVIVVAQKSDEPIEDEDREPPTIFLWHKASSTKVCIPRPASFFACERVARAEFPDLHYEDEIDLNLIFGGKNSVMEFEAWQHVRAGDTIEVEPVEKDQDFFDIVIKSNYHPVESIVSVRDRTFVRHLKRIIESSRSGFTMANTQLTYNNKYLQDNWQIEDYAIEEGAVVNLWRTK